jgi:hypothetical protein
MTHNVGSADRTVRVIVGLLVLSMLFIDGNARWFGLIGLVPLLTALIGSCPLYSIFGVSTHPKPQPKM